MKQALEEYDRQHRERSLSQQPPPITFSATPMPADVEPVPQNGTKQRAPSTSMADYDLIKLRYLRSLNIPMDSRRFPLDPAGGVAASAPIPIPIASLAARLEMESSSEEEDEDDDDDDSEGEQPAEATATEPRVVGGTDSPDDTIVVKREEAVPQKRKAKKKKEKVQDKENGLGKRFVPPHELILPSSVTIKHSLPTQYQLLRKKNTGL